MTHNAQQADAQFQTWMKQVDSILMSRLGGLTHDDLRDRCWYDAFESDGMTPEEAVDELVGSDLDEMFDSEFWE